MQVSAVDRRAERLLRQEQVQLTIPLRQLALSDVQHLVPRIGFEDNDAATVREHRQRRLHAIVTRIGQRLFDIEFRESVTRRFGLDDEERTSAGLHEKIRTLERDAIAPRRGDEKFELRLGRRVVRYGIPEEREERGNEETLDLRLVSESHRGNVGKDVRVAPGHAATTVPYAMFDGLYWCVDASCYSLR